MSLLQICQDSAREIGIRVPDTIIGNAGNVESQKLLRYATKVGNRFMKLSVWQALRTERTFTGLHQIFQTGILPPDFDRMTPETVWDRSSRFQIAYASAVEWQSMLAAQSAQQKFTYIGDAIGIYPLLQGGNVLAFEYMSKDWVKPVTGDPTDVFADDTDETFFDQELMVQGTTVAYTLGEGLAQGTGERGLDSYLNDLIPDDQPKSDVMTTADIFSGGRHSTGEPGSTGGIVSPDRSGETWGNTNKVWGV